MRNCSKGEIVLRRLMLSIVALLVITVTVCLVNRVLVTTHGGGVVTFVLPPVDSNRASIKAFFEWHRWLLPRTMDHMNLRATHVVLLSLLCAQATLTATPSYFTFGIVQPFDLYNGTTTFTAGNFNEVIAPGVTTQSIDCINA